MTHPPSPLHRDSQPRHLVRPRWVWGGLLLALIGAGTLGLGLIVLSATVSVVGATVLLLGATASLRGGVLYDAVPNLAVRREFRQVREGDVHPGTAPGDTLPTTAARRDTAETNRSTRSREAAALHHGDVRWAPVAGWILLVVTIVLTASQWELVAPTVTGRANSFRDTGLAILLGVTGLRTGPCARTSWHRSNYRRSRRTGPRPRRAVGRTRPRWNRRRRSHQWVCRHPLRTICLLVTHPERTSLAEVVALPVTRVDQITCWWVWLSSSVVAQGFWVRPLGPAWQWFAVKATYLDVEDLERDLVVQCDRPEYSPAAIWKHLADESRLAVELAARDDTPSSPADRVRNRQPDSCI